jgi:hypothetical protein
MKPLALPPLVRFGALALLPAAQAREQVLNRYSARRHPAQPVQPG